MHRRRSNGDAPHATIILHKGRQETNVWASSLQFSGKRGGGGQLSTNGQPCASAPGHVIQGNPEVRSIGRVNEATSTGENEPRRAARKRYQTHYRALYDQL